MDSLFGQKYVKEEKVEKKLLLFFFKAKDDVLKNQIVSTTKRCSVYRGSLLFLFLNN